MQSNFGNRSKERSGLDLIGPDGELVIGSHLGVRLMWIGHWSGWTVDCGEELVGIKEIIPPSSFTPAGPFSLQD